jgi:hypothetical protein
VLFRWAFRVWSALVAIQGISEMHSLRFPRAVLIFILPLVIVALVSFFIVILLIVQGVGYLSSL